MGTKLFIIVQAYNNESITKILPKLDHRNYIYESSPAPVKHSLEKHSKG